jgi:hypothetical protein
MPAAKTSKTGEKRTSTGVTESLTSLAEQLINRIIRPFDLVLLSRERIQEALDEAAERGRVTRRDANELVADLMRRGREQTDELLGQVGRAAGRARRSVGGGSTLAIENYDELTASQVNKQLPRLKPGDLQRVRDYEARHANRKSVLDAVDRALR